MGDHRQPPSFFSADAFSGFDGFTNNAAGYDVKFALEDKLFTIGEGEL